jgi:ATP-dependent Lon protease
MSGAEHVQDQELPSTLSILPLKNRILLPSSAMKLLLTSPRSVALVDAILSSTSARGGNHHSLYVGVVPLRRDPRANSNAFAAAAGMLDDTEDTEDAQHAHGGGANIAAPEDERARLHDVGTAARVVQIARKDSPVRSYTLLLEGRCRFAVDKLTAVHPFIVAEVRQLDAAGNGVQLNGGAGGDPEDDPELESVAASFKDRARELVDRLERRKGHARRLKSMLESAPAHRLADLFVAAFEDSFDARLELLSTTCPKVTFFSFTRGQLDRLY